MFDQNERTPVESYHLGDAEYDRAGDDAGHLALDGEGRQLSYGTTLLLHAGDAMGTVVLALLSSAFVMCRRQTNFGSSNCVKNNI